MKIREVPEHAIKEIMNKLSLLTPDTSLDEMLETQRRNVHKYIDKGSLPPLPIGVNERKDQQFFRDICGWITEEIAETSNEFYKLEALRETPHKVTELYDTLWDLNEELIDVYTFTLELMVYAQIDRLTLSNLIDLYMQSVGGLKEDNVKYFDETHDMDHRVNVALHFILQQYRLPDMQSWNLHQYPKLKTGLILGGNYLFNFMEVQRLLWLIVESLYQIVRLLKAKPWVKNPIPTDPDDFQIKVAQFYVTVHVLMALMGHGTKSIHYLYSLKDYINNHRQSNNY